MQVPAMAAMMALALVASAASTTSAASAASPSAAPEADVDAARADFVEGTTYFQARRWEEALASFEHSYRAVDSPNTELMIARCLRELGRRVAAAQAFDRANGDALHAVAKGESRYAPAANAASTEGAALRATLGTVHVHVAHPTDVAVLVDGQPATLPANGEIVVLHEPSAVEVVVRPVNGPQARQVATVTAGTSTRMEFEGGSPPIVFSPPPPPALSWSVPAAFAGGAVTIAGFSLFTIFGLDSRATYDDLAKKCGNVCPESERARAEDGRRSQTIANVSLVVGLAAAIATGLFVYVATTDHGAKMGR